MAANPNEKNDHLKSQKWFRRNAQQIINEMIDLSTQTRENTSALVDEILHSILFLGEICDPPFSPEDILRDDDDENLLEDLKDCYPRPFEFCSSQLPRRSPFSCVLDMMVHLYGQENEEEIRRRLQQFINEVENCGPSEHLSKKDIKNRKQLISTAICVSQKSNDSVIVRHYGVSMSTSGRKAGRIMVAASCHEECSAWDDYVVGAVMTSYPEEKEEESKKSYFDGTINIPDKVRCQAFNIRTGREMNPCRSCGNMFGLKTNETRKWAYGHCAEVESLSNLLKNEREVKDKSQPTSNTWTDENINLAREHVHTELMDLLKMAKFQWGGKFYTPQEISV